MFSIPPSQVPAIIDALSQFRLGDPSRFLEPSRAREEFIDFGWKRAAAAAGLTEAQRYASSGLFFAHASFVDNAVGFYLADDPAKSSGQLYLGRDFPTMPCAFRLYRLNPDLGPDFPEEEPRLLSIVMCARGKEPTYHAFLKCQDFWAMSPS